MNIARNDEIRTALQRRRREILRKAKASVGSESIPVSDVVDEVERAATEMEASLDFTLRQIEDGDLQKIDQALFRLREGTYGSCLGCGGSISAKRLKAQPFALRCKNCQEWWEGEVVNHRRPARSIFGFL